MSGTQVSSSAEASNLMGMLAAETDRYDIAIEHLTKATKLAPDQPKYFNNLGTVLLLAGEPRKALRVLNKAIKLFPSYAEAIFNSGQAHFDLGHPDMAIRCFEESLKINPNHIPARGRLAELHVEMGHSELAVEAFRKILAEDPKNVPSLSGIAIAKRFDASDPECALIEQRLQDSDLRDDDRVDLHHALGKIFNDLGRYDQAILSYIEGKRAAKLGFPIEKHGRDYAILKQRIGPSFFERQTAFGDPTEAPVFIVGMPRSGTTLVEQIISSHRHASGAGELNTMTRMSNDLEFQTNIENYCDRLWNINRKSVRQLAQKYLKVLHRSSKNAIRITDKNPHNYEQLGLISLLFPNARVVVCERNPLDTCVSCFMQRFSDSHSYNCDLETMGAYYREYRLLLRHWQDVIPLRTHSVRYEELVGDPEIVIRDMISFLGLEWDNKCLQFFEASKTVTTPSRWQVRQPIYTTSINRWKRYQSHLTPLIEALGDLALENRADEDRTADGTEQPLR